MIDLFALERYCNGLLDSGSFDDYCPNGLQLDAGNREIRRLGSAVTASLSAVEMAVEQGCDLLLVHHGYFWRGEPAPLTGVKGRRVRALVRGGVSLLAYHLPLDAHPELGNNRCLGDLLGMQGSKPLADSLVWQGELPAEPLQAFARRLEGVLERAPLVISGGDHPVQRVGWCTGAAQSAIQEAARAGLDTFVSGEISETTTHLARELGIHYLAAGHHASERYGVQALARHLAEKFDLEHRFLDDPNPV